MKYFILLTTLCLITTSLLTSTTKSSTTVNGGGYDFLNANLSVFKIQNHHTAFHQTCIFQESIPKIQFDMNNEMISMKFEASLSSNYYDSVHFSDLAKINRDQSVQDPQKFYLVFNRKDCGIYVCAIKLPGNLYRQV
jgi:hypothetical protein